MNCENLNGVCLDKYSDLFRGLRVQKEKERLFKQDFDEVVELYIQNPEENPDREKNLRDAMTKFLQDGFGSRTELIAERILIERYGNGKELGNAEQLRKITKKTVEDLLHYTHDNDKTTP